MKNPFQKDDNKLLIAGITVGSLAAGATAYLLMTERGKQIRTQLADKFGHMYTNFFGNRNSEAHTEETPAYMQHKGKAPKTDREKLLKHEILHEPGQEGPAEG